MGSREIEENDTCSGGDEAGQERLLDKALAVTIPGEAEAGCNEQLVKKSHAHLETGHGSMPGDGVNDA